MAEAFTIQNTTWRDLSALRQVENECFGPDAWPLLDLIAALTFPDVIHLKAVVGTRMVGFVGGDLRRSEGLGWITTLAVLPAFRRQGIASSLLAACEDAIDLPRIHLCVRRDNEGAILLYHKYGYAQVGVWPRYYQDGQDALVLEKRQP
ncbi:MAG: GNAT family N-acetyltransferase [Anaerolineaceae bacterium]|nr:GNAT family N-acetyltransferase [Anaerolineaceae bacterium]